MNIKLAIIGHLAYNKDVTPTGTKVSNGGSAYYSAVGASISNPKGVGIIAAVGKDYKIDTVSRLGINIAGINVNDRGATAKFTIYQHENGTRQFEAEWGVAKDVQTLFFPKEYSNIKYVHLSTAPPQQYIKWIKSIRKSQKNVIISIDTFEEFSKAFTEETLKAIELADFIFINEDEAQILNLQESDLSKKPYILKKGPQGAILYDGLKRTFVAAPSVNVVDTTGAGDILAGAFLALLSNGEKMEYALEKAVKFASKSVSNFGVDHLLNH